MGRMTTNFDHQLHAFRTLLPPDVETPPACGKTITRAYGLDSKPTERCPECDALVSEHIRNSRIANHERMNRSPEPFPSNLPQKQGLPSNRKKV